MPDLDGRALEEKAIEWARIHGLQGTPIAKRVVAMSLGEWNALDGGQLAEGAKQYGVSDDTPVLVYAIRGQVDWKGLGSSFRNPGIREQYDNITIVLDARNGKILAARSLRLASEMPVQVPLNTLTPVPPIILAPTRKPQMPPTLVPTATDPINIPTPVTNPYP